MNDTDIVARNSAYQGKVSQSISGMLCKSSYVYSTCRVAMKVCYEWVHACRD